METPGTLARLTRLAIPVALGRLGVVGMGLVDMIVVGQLATRELPHQALGWALNGPAMLGGIGLLLGVQVLSARAIGGGDERGAGRMWRRGLVIAFAAGLTIVAVYWLAGQPFLRILGVTPNLVEPAAAVGRILALSIPFHLAFVATTYFLEALQRPVPGAIAMWAANGVNLALNLGFVPHWGAIGSAWATVGSRAFLFAALAIFVLSRRELDRYLERGQQERGPGYGALLTVGLAAAVSAIVEAGAFSALGLIAGRISAETVAVFVIATGGLVTLVYLIAQGFATAGAVLASAAIGRGERATAIAISWRALALTVLAMAGSGLACIVFAEPVAHMFSADAHTALTLAACMPLVALLMIPDGGQGVLDSVLRAQGENWRPTLLRMAPFVLIAPPLAYWLAERAGQGVVGILAALTAASSLAFVLLIGLQLHRHRAMR